MINQPILLWFDKSRLRSPILFIILLLNGIGFFYYYRFFLANNYLPAPFLYDKTDTFMDLFNPMYWAYNDGRYEFWGSVYPPLNFIFLKIINFFFESGSLSDALEMRLNSEFTINFLLLSYLLIPAFILTTKPWSFLNKLEKFSIYSIVVLSTPMLFVLERGNLILFVPILLNLLLFVYRFNFVRLLSIAILINIKPYFLILVFFYIAKRQWGKFLDCITLTACIFFITGFYLDNHFLLFFENLLGFSQSDEVFSIREIIALPSSVSAFSSVFRYIATNQLQPYFLYSGFIEVFANLIDLMKYTLIATAFLLIIRKNTVLEDDYIFFILILIIINMGVQIGGYSMIFYYVFIPFILKQKNYLLPLSLIMLIYSPLDMINIISESSSLQTPFLSGKSVEVFWSIGFGSILRPLLNFSLLVVFIRRLFVIDSNRMTSSEK